MIAASKQRDRTHFLKDMERLGAHQAPETISALRRSGAARFQELDYPDSRMETWRHTNVAPLLKIPWASLIEPPRTDIAESMLQDRLPSLDMPVRLVFVDGFYCPKLSRVRGLREDAYAGGLADALSSPMAERLQALLAESPQPQHVFGALNSAFLQDGPVVCLPDNCTMDVPIHVVLATGMRPAQFAAHMRTVITVGENAAARVVLHHVALPGTGSYFNNHVEDINLGANASLQRTEIIHERDQGYHMAATHAQLARDSRLHSCAVTLDGGAITRNEMRVVLNGANADARLHGLYLNRGRGLIDHDMHIAHMAPHCVSRMRYKGVLEDASRSVFRGMVYVAREAQKTDSKQINANMALSEKARIDAKPQLEIYADDVKCTHGATVGGPPEEQIFYLRSRGINAAQAQGMLTYGFASDVAAQIADDGTRKHVAGYLYERLYNSRIPKQTMLNTANE